MPSLTPRKLLSAPLQNPRGLGTLPEYVVSTRRRPNSEVGRGYWGLDTNLRGERRGFPNELLVVASVAVHCQPRWLIRCSVGFECSHALRAGSPRPDRVALAVGWVPGGCCADRSVGGERGKPVESWGGSSFDQPPPSRTSRVGLPSTVKYRSSWMPYGSGCQPFPSRTNRVGSPPAVKYRSSWMPYGSGCQPLSSPGMALYSPDTI